MLMHVCVYAQEDGVRGIDSFQALLDHHPQHDTLRVSLLGGQSFLYFGVNAALGIDRGNEALHIAEELNWAPGIAYALTSIGANYWAQSNFSKAADYYLQSFEIHKKLKMHRLMASDLVSLGVINAAIGNYNNAIKYYYAAIKEADETGDHRLRIGSLYNIGITYNTMGNYDLAIKATKEGIATARRYNIVNEYIAGEFNLAQWQTLVKQYDSAQNILNNLLNGVYGPVNEFKKGQSNLQLGTIMIEQKRYKEALFYKKKALDIFRSIHYTMEVAECALQIARIYIDNARKATSVKQRNTSLALAEKYLQPIVSYSEASINLNELMQASFMMAGIFEKRGDYKKAYYFYQQGTTYSDSLNRKGNEQGALIKTLDFNYKRSRDSIYYINQLHTVRLKGFYHKKLLDNYRKKQTILYGLLVSLAVICIVIILLYTRSLQNTRLKSSLNQEILNKQLVAADFERKMNQLSMVALQSQMDPHFIFNCLNSIRLLIEQNEAEVASLYLTKFARLIRVILEYSSKEFIALEDEIESLRLYLDLEKLRFKEKLEYTLQVSESLDTEQTELPPMLIQPFIENAIWHGLMYKTQGGQIRIRLEDAKEEQTLVVTVEDNGIGLEQSKAYQSSLREHTSHGIEFTRERLKLLGKKINRDWSLSIVELKDQNEQVAGTLVTIKIPYV